MSFTKIMIALSEAVWLVLIAIITYGVYIYNV